MGQHLLEHRKQNVYVFVHVCVCVCADSNAINYICRLNWTKRRLLNGVDGICLANTQLIYFPHITTLHHFTHFVVVVVFFYCNDAVWYDDLLCVCVFVLVVFASNFFPDLSLFRFWCNQERAVMSKYIHANTDSHRHTVVYTHSHSHAHTPNQPNSKTERR